MSNEDRFDLGGGNVGGFLHDVCVRSRDLSYAMLGFYLVGVLLWLAYGIIVNALAIIIANAATGTLIVVATGLKAWTHRRPRSPQGLARQASERA